MDEERATARAGLTAARAEEAFLHLAALGVEAWIERSDDGRCELLVARADEARALAILAEAEAEAEPEAGAGAAGDPSGAGGDGEPSPLRKTSLAGPDATSGDSGDAWIGWNAATAAVAAVVLACTAIFLWTTRGAPEATYARMLAAGAVIASRVDAGEAWRLVSAVFLHFDLAHLIANMAILLLVGPLLAHLLGPLRFVAVFVAAGVAGNVASYLFAPSPALKAGASGAVAGVLGALAGQALRAGRRSRFAPWQVLGAIAAAYALLVGAEPGRDHVAHLGGLLAGIALGRALGPAPPWYGGACSSASTSAPRA